MSKIERRDYFCASSLSLETREDAAPEIVGLASVFYDGTERTEYEVMPGFRERIMPSAFDEALSRPDDVRGLFNHEPTNLLGRTSSGTMRLEKAPEGLRYRIQPGETQVSRDVMEHIRRGDVTGSSFAFFVTRSTWIESGDVDIRQIDSVELWDVGPVTYPAYSATSVGVRALGDVEAEYRALLDHKEHVSRRVQREMRERRLQLLRLLG